MFERLVRSGSKRSRLPDKSVLQTVKDLWASPLSRVPIDTDEHLMSEKVDIRQVKDPIILSCFHSALMRYCDCRTLRFEPILYDENSLAMVNNLRFTKEQLPPNFRLISGITQIIQPYRSRIMDRAVRRCVMRVCEYISEQIQENQFEVIDRVKSKKLHRTLSDIELDDQASEPMLDWRTRYQSSASNDPLMSNSSKYVESIKQRRVHIVELGVGFDMRFERLLVETTRLRKQNPHGLKPGMERRHFTAEGFFLSSMDLIQAGMQEYGKMLNKREKMKDLKRRGIIDDEDPDLVITDSEDDESLPPGAQPEYVPHIIASVIQDKDYFGAVGGIMYHECDLEHVFPLRDELVRRAKEVPNDYDLYGVYNDLGGRNHWRVQWKLPRNGFSSTKREGEINLDWLNRLRCLINDVNDDNDRGEGIIQFSENVVFVAEGLFNHLSIKDATEILNTIAEFFPGCFLVVDETAYVTLNFEKICGSLYEVNATTVERLDIMLIEEVTKKLPLWFRCFFFPLLKKSQSVVVLQLWSSNE